MIQAVIFDLDGTVLDSEGMWEQVFKEVSQKNGIEKPHGSQWFHVPGLGVEKNWKKIVPDQNQDLIDSLSKQARELFNESESPLRDGVEELIEAIKDKGWQTGLATESHWINVENILESLNMALAFDVVTTGDEIFYHKPDPEIFNLTIQKMGLEPQEVIIIEDSVVGVEAAVEAGIEVIGIANEFFGETELKAAGAKLVVDNFSDVMVLLPNHGNENSETP